MKPLTLRQALTLLHEKTLHVERIRAHSADDGRGPLGEVHRIAGQALSSGPNSRQLCALLASLPTDTDTGGGLACPRCGWDELQPSDLSRAARIPLRFPPRPILPVTDAAFAAPFVCVHCGQGRETQPGPCEHCGAGFPAIPNIRGTKVGRPTPAPAPVPCPRCDGTGETPNGAVCPTCRGEKQFAAAKTS